MSGGGRDGGWAGEEENGVGSNGNGDRCWVAFLLKRVNGTLWLILVWLVVYTNALRYIAILCTPPHTPTPLSTDGLPGCVDLH